MRIAIASGKGGTGKTTVSVALALANHDRARLIDCDVEAPNAGLFLPGATIATTPIVASIPQVDPDLCTRCGLCVKFCNYNALALAGPAGLLVFSELCHDCGGCILVCPHGALSSVDVTRGEVATSVFEDSLELVTGRLQVGSPSAPTVIRAAISTRPLQERSFELLDAPPGTACSFATTVRSARFCLLVTDSTPFGVHDLRLAAQALRDMRIPCGVVVNRSSEDDSLAEIACLEMDLPILLRIPESRSLAETYARGGTLLDTDRCWAERMRALLDTIAIFCAARTAP